MDCKLRPLIVQLLTSRTSPPTGPSVKHMNPRRVTFEALTVHVKDTESVCCAVRWQTPVWACHNLIVWSYPPVTNITWSLLPWTSLLIPGHYKNHNQGRLQYKPQRTKLHNSPFTEWALIYNMYSILHCRCCYHANLPQHFATLFTLHSIFEDPCPLWPTSKPTIFNIP